MSGWGFTVDNGVTVTSLGVWDRDDDGLSGSHEVGIWRVSDHQLIVSGTVPSGTAGTLIDRFRYVTLGTPAALPAGDYRIGALYGADTDAVGYFATSASLAPGLSNFVSNCYVQSSTLAFPSSNGSFAKGDFGPNFLIVPEPATLSLAVLVGLALIRRHRTA